VKRLGGSRPGIGGVLFATKSIQNLWVCPAALQGELTEPFVFR